MSNSTLADRLSGPIGRTFDRGRGLLQKLGRVWNVSTADSEHQLGLNWQLIGCAILATGFTYVLMNTYLTRAVDAAYYQAPVSAIMRGKSVDDRVTRLVAEVGGDPRVANEAFLKEAVRAVPPDSTCRALAIEVMQRVQNTLPPSAIAVMDRHLTGRRTGWPFLYLVLRPVSGAAIIDELREQIPEWSHKNSIVESDASPLKAQDIDLFLAKLLDRVAQENRAQIRGLMRISGSIQWLTILVFWTILLLVARRFWMLNNTLPADSFSASASGAAQAKENSVATATRGQVYGAFEFLIGLLPSLGFVGTVLGMGDALLTADGLFSSSDKAQAISIITKHLGFAFDTTLVGLVTGMICGAAVMSLRTWETRRSLCLADDRRGVAA